MSIPPRGRAPGPAPEPVVSTHTSQPVRVENYEQLMDRLRIELDSRVRVFKANPSPANSIGVQKAMLAYQATEAASTGIRRAELVWKWNQMSHSLDGYVGRL